MFDTTQIEAALGDRLLSRTERLGELTIEVAASGMLDSLKILRDAGFDQMIDLCGVDYLSYGEGRWEGRRFASVYHLLSTGLNERIRVKVFAADDEFPILDSSIEIWPAANWYEREAFDLYGIIFSGHPDLRRILTDYGFVGSPFRKDFPLSGNVEMKYDPDLGRVIYQPVSIPAREITPRIVREDNYGEL